jgi:uncharacterized RDD family membrane protein YckC
MEMYLSEMQEEQKILIKASILNRSIAKIIDFIIIAILIEAIPKIGYLAGLLYLLIGDGLFEGKSIGKRLLGLKVVLHEGGGACTFSASAIRNLILVVGYVLMLIPLIGFIFPLVIIFLEGILMIGSDRGLRFGDELAKTQVIEERQL